MTDKTKLYQAIGMAIQALIDATLAEKTTPVDPPADPPTDAPAPADPPVPVDPPAPPAPPAPPKVVSQELIPSKCQVMVGETFTVESTLLLDDQTTKPVTANAFSWDRALLSSPNGWTPWFTALAPGVAKIRNSNSGTTGRTSVTIIPSDGTVFPAPPTTTKPPAPPSDGNPKPPAPPVDSTKPAPSVYPEAPANSPVGSGPNKAIVKITDGAGRIWTAVGNVGDDAAAQGMTACLVNDAGEPHPRFQAKFYADCCKANVARMDNAFDELGCILKVTYNGEDVTPPSSYEDGTYDFWRGCQMPTIRYGKQVPWDASKIDRSVMPDYTTETQVPVSIAKMDFRWNGQGGSYVKDMNNPGERGEIGYYMTLMMAFILGPSDETWHAVRMAEDWSGNWSMVGVCEPATQRFIKYTDYPAATTMSRAQSGAYQSKNPIALYGGSYRGDVLTPSASNWSRSGSPFTPNGAHLTSFGKMAAMITGAAQDLDNASFWAAHTTLDINPSYTRSGGCMMGPQRRAAWCLGTMLVAAYYSSDTEFWSAEVDRNVEIANGMIRNDFGIMETSHEYGGKGDAYKYTGTALWQHTYLGMTTNAVMKKKPAAIPFAKFLGKLEKTWGEKVYVPIRTIYTFICYGPDGKLLADFDQMAHLSMTNGGYTEEDADAMIAATTQDEVYAIMKRNDPKWTGKLVNGVCDFHGNPLSPDSYPAGAIANTMAAANCGTPGIEPMVAQIEALPTKPDYDKNQKYHLELAAKAA